MANEPVLAKKICGACKVPKLIDEFNRKSSSRDGRQASCRACMNDKSDAHYVENKPAYAEKNARHKKKMREERQKQMAWDSIQDALRDRAYAAVLRLGLAQKALHDDALNQDSEDVDMRHQSCRGKQDSSADDPCALHLEYFEASAEVNELAQELAERPSVSVRP